MNQPWLSSTIPFFWFFQYCLFFEDTLRSGASFHFLKDGCL
jgi:hypothetical protein